MTTFIQTMAGLPGPGGAAGAPGAQGAQGRPGYKLFPTWAAAEAVTGAFANQAAVVTESSGTHIDPVTDEEVDNRGRYAWSVSPAGWQWIDADVAAAQGYVIEAVTPPNVNSGWSQTGISHDTPSRDEGGSPSSVRFALTFTYGPYAANEQFAGQQPYTNNVFGLSWNLNSSFTPIDTSKGGPSFRVESRFKKPSRNPATPTAWVDGAEFHHAMHTKGVGGEEFRPISIFAPHATADWGFDSDVSMAAAVYAFADGYRNVHISCDWAGAEGDEKTVSLSDQVTLASRGNNRRWLSQQNAAGNAQVSLLYLNDANGVQFDRDIYMAVDTPLTNALGIQSLLSLVGVAGLTNGARLCYLLGNAVTGSVTGYEGEISASTRFEGWKIKNQHASGASGGRIVGNGVQYLDFYNEANFLRWGMRLKADGNFTIGQSEQGTDIADAIRINFTTLQTEFMKAPKLPSATVAGAGSAASAGPGALHYVTDLNATTVGSVAAGGGTNDGVVVSDGTAWRIMVAWA